MLILGHTIRLLEEAGGDETNEVLPESGGRFVAENSRSGNIRGRTILTILYMCVLGLCFVIPVFYCIRVYYEERNARRLRELEIAGIAQAMEQSQLGREESRAARRKYREEQRARIVQLFAPVRMVRTRKLSSGSLHHCFHSTNAFVCMCVLTDFEAREFSTFTGPKNRRNNKRISRSRKRSKIGHRLVFVVILGRRTRRKRSKRKRRIE